MAPAFFIGSIIFAGQTTTTFTAFEVTDCWKAGGQLPQQPQNDYDLLDLVKCIQNFRPELPHCSRPIITEQVNYTGTKGRKRT